MTWENNIEDDMLWTLNGAADHNVASSDTITLSAAGAAHPIGAGFTAGDVKIFNSAQSMAYGLPAASAHLLGTIPFQSTQNNLFTFNAGDLLIDGTSTAKGRRVLFPLDDNSWNDINANGRKLFDQAVAWIAEHVDVAATLTVTTSGSNITVSWTPAGGTLQSAPTVAGPWTTVTGAATPYTTSAATGTTFFRVSNP